MRRPIRWLVVVLAAWLCACIRPTVHFQAQEIQIRRDVLGGGVDILLLYRGVQARDDSEDALAATVRGVDAMIARKRYFNFTESPFEFDWDGDVLERSTRDHFAEQIRDAESDQRRAALTTLRDLFDALVVVDAGLFRDEHDALGVWQHIRHPRTGELLDALDVGARLAVGDACAAGALGDDDGELREALLAKVRARSRWVELDENGLQVFLPTTPKASAELIRELGDWRMFAEGLDAFQVSDGQARLRWSYDSDGRLEFRGRIARDAARERPRALAARLLARNLDRAKLPTLADVRKKLLR